MKVIKKINNNVALCIDQGGKELIALGKGIGFKAMPYELQDLSGIERTFYAVKTDTLPVLDEIDEELFADTGYIVSQDVYKRQVLWGEQAEQQALRPLSL